MMQYRTLGHTGLKTSILGLGGFHLVEISPEDVKAVANRFLDAGGNYVETAPQYGDGESERKLGPVIAERRAECILATKTHVREREGAAEFFEQSLRRLQTDHVDALFMHHIQTQDELDCILAPDGALRMAEAARDAGQVRFIGISNHGHPQLMIRALESYPFDMIMTNFNYYDRFNFPLIEAELLPLAQERGVGIVGMKAIADGFLWRSAEVAFRYAWSLPIDVMVAGMNTVGILERDLAWAGALTPLSGDDRDRLFAEAPELGNYVCRLCGKCLPCPEGVDIPGIFTLEGWYDRQMWDGVVREPGDYWMRQSLRFWFMNEGRAREAYGALKVKADACTDCGECEPRCPYKLPIVDKLRKAHYKLTVEPRDG
jgi:predicted aldo/keto reductase-like oxidoreductase